MERNSIEGMKCMRKVAILGTRGGGKEQNGREEEARGVSLSFSLRHDFSTVLTKTRIKPDQLDRVPTTPHNSSFVRS